MDQVDSNDKLDAVKRKSAQLVLDAEKFNATINKPPGTEPNQNATCLDIDDKFFHVTCHIDYNLRTKIEKRDFVDLEKLLPKQKGKVGLNENKLDLVYQDGH